MALPIAHSDEKSVIYVDATTVKRRIIVSNDDYDSSFSKIINDSRLCNFLGATDSSAVSQ